MRRRALPAATGLGLLAVLATIAEACATFGEAGAPSETDASEASVADAASDVVAEVPSEGGADYLFLAIPGWSMVVDNLVCVTR